MVTPRALSADELAQLDPEQRQALLRVRTRAGLEDLDPAFRARAEATGRRLLEERGRISLGGPPLPRSAGAAVTEAFRNILVF